MERCYYLNCPNFYVQANLISIIKSFGSATLGDGLKENFERTQIRANTIINNNIFLRNVLKEQQTKYFGLKHSFSYNASVILHFFFTFTLLTMLSLSIQRTNHFTRTKIGLSYKKSVITTTKNIHKKKTLNKFAITTFGMKL